RSKLKRLGKTPPKIVTTSKLINPIMMPKTLTMIIHAAFRVGTKGLNKLVDEVFQKLLTAARVRGGLAFPEHVGLEFSETHFALLDFPAHTRIPPDVAQVDELRPAAAPSY